MTDTEATRIVAEWMGIRLLDEDQEYSPDRGFYVSSLGLGENWFNPLYNAQQEQLVREWAWDNLTPKEKREVWHLMNGVAIHRLTEVVHDLELSRKTGDLTKAVARVLAERKETDDE